MSDKSKPTSDGQGGEPQGNQQPGTQFPQFIPGTENVDNSEQLQQQASPPSEIDELRAQMKTMQDQFNERETFYRNSLETMLSQRVQPVQQQQQRAPEPLSFDDLPDPVQNPKEYNRALAERINLREQQLTNTLSQQFMGQMTRAQTMDSLWNRFTIQQPELAKRSALLQGAAAVTFNELRMRGVDPESIAQQNPDSLIGLIAQRMQSELGISGQQGGQSPAQQQGSPARTQGIQGGSTLNGAASQKPVKTLTLADTIKKQQKDLGIL